METNCVNPKSLTASRGKETRSRIPPSAEQSTSEPTAPHSLDCPGEPDTAVSPSSQPRQEQESFVAEQHTGPVATDAQERELYETGFMGSADPSILVDPYIHQPYLYPPYYHFGQFPVPRWTVQSAVSTPSAGQPDIASYASPEDAQLSPDAGNDVPLIQCLTDKALPFIKEAVRKEIKKRFSSPGFIMNLMHETGEPIAQHRSHPYRRNRNKRPRPGAYSTFPES